MLLESILCPKNWLKTHTDVDALHISTYTENGHTAKTDSKSSKNPSHKLTGHSRWPYWNGQQVKSKLEDIHWSQYSKSSQTSKTFTDHCTTGQVKTRRHLLSLYSKSSQHSQTFTVIVQQVKPKLSDIYCHCTASQVKTWRHLLFIAQQVKSKLEDIYWSLYSK